MLKLIFAFFFHVAFFSISHSNVIHGKENQDAVINFCLFPFFLFFIFHSSVIQKGNLFQISQELLCLGFVVLCKRESTCCYLLFPYLSIFSFSLSKFSVTNFSASMRARVFKFCIHIESDQAYCGTENKTEIYSAFFFLFSISHSNVIHREICDKYFSGTIAHKIL